MANRVKPSFLPKEHSNKDFKVQVVVNNNMDTVMADTGARISVFGSKQAKKWNRNLSIALKWKFLSVAFSIGL